MSWLTGVRLSPSEAKYLREGVAQGVRQDGRGLFDLRHVHVKTSLLPHANGSARVRMLYSSSDVLCGVKFEVGGIDDPAVQCTVEMGALARSDLFGPVEASKRAERRGIEMVDLLIKWIGNTIDLPPLIPGKAKWITYVDCTVFGDGGNIQDAVMVAIYCALRDARIPQTTPNEDGTDFEINPDFNTAIKLLHDRFSLTSTAYFIAGHVVVDPTPEEEACADCALSVNVDRYGNVRSISKIGGSGAVPLDAIKSALSVACSTSKQMLKFLDSYLDEESKAYDSRLGKLVFQDPETWNEVSLTRNLE